MIIEATVLCLTQNISLHKFVFKEVESTAQLIEVAKHWVITHCEYLAYQYEVDCMQGLHAYHLVGVGSNKPDN